MSFFDGKSTLHIDAKTHFSTELLHGMETVAALQKTVCIRKYFESKPKIKARCKVCREDGAKAVILFSIYSIALWELLKP